MPFELHGAVESGNLESVKSHINSGANINEFNGYGQTPLFIAANLHFSNELASFLLTKGANVNLGCRFTDNPPIQAACLRGNVELVDMLIKSGAKVEEWILNLTVDLASNIFDNTFIKITKLFIPTLLLENSTISKPWYVKEVKKLSSF